MDGLKPHEIEILRRSVAMAPPGGPPGLNREVALTVLSQLLEVMDESGRLRAKMVELGLA